jgi:hypothetical protein
MAECKSNEQRLREECDQYRTASAEAKEKLKVMIS